MTTEEKLQGLLKKADTGDVYEIGSLYVVFSDGEITEMPAGVDTVKSAYYPDIITGTNEEEFNRVNEVIESFDLDFDDFSAAVEDFYLDTEYDEEVLDVLSDELDEDKYERVVQLVDAINSGKTAIGSMFELIDLLRRADLSRGALYYMWEDGYIDLYDNVLDCGLGRGEYESYSDEEWIEILENITDYIVEPEEIDYSEYINQDEVDDEEW